MARYRTKITGVGRLFLALAALTAAAPVQAADSAVVLMYHRFGDGRTPSTNIRLDQLDAHIAELQRGGYHVLPLPEVVEALRSGRSLPDKAVAITVDDAWASTYRHAWPRFKAAGFPFTVFVVTDETDRGGTEYMTWPQLRELADSGLVTIGSQGAAHPHMAAIPAAAAMGDLSRAAERFAAELGRVPDLVAWPFGETAAAVMDLGRMAGFKAGFGQHSGVAWAKSDSFYLPRFALNETYGELDRFRMAVRALPLPAVDITPVDPLVGVNPPAFGFTLADATLPNGVACYGSFVNGGAVTVDRVGPRVEVRMSKPLPKGRSRLNCTLPSLDGRWRWFGWQFYVN